MITHIPKFWTSLQSEPTACQPVRGDVWTEELDGAAYQKAPNISTGTAKLASLAGGRWKENRFRQVPLLQGGGVLMLG